MTRKIKVILWLAVIIILAIGIKITFQMVNNRVEGEKQQIIDRQKISREQRLVEPDLLYFSSSWSGMCTNDKGERGGCYTEIFLYSSGKFIKESGWEGENKKKEIQPTVEQYFVDEIMDDITRTIRTSGVLAKDCPPRQIMDAGWDYQINLDGVIKFFHNPLQECKDIFDNIEQIIDSTNQNT